MRKEPMDEADKKVYKVMLSLPLDMKLDVEECSKDLGISEAGFFRLLVRLYMKDGIITRVAALKEVHKTLERDVDYVW
jgi:predicted transcriptional regulator